MIPPKTPEREVYAGLQQPKKACYTSPESTLKAKESSKRGRIDFDELNYAYLDELASDPRVPIRRFKS
jgi:hypothetical protein